MHLIVNMNAGRSRRLLKDAERVVVRLSERGIKAEISATYSLEEAKEAIASAVDGPGVSPAVVAVGGDGTLRFIVGQLLGRDVAIGLIPGGTANVVARELGIPIDLKGATEVLLEGHIRRLDIGRIRRTLGDGPGFDDVFLAMVGVGIDADVVENVLPGPFKMTRFGVALTRRLIRGQPAPLRLTVDGVERPGPTFGTIVANTANYGGWFSACPDARPDDGDLDWLQVRGKSRRASLRVLAAMVRKRRGPPAVAHYGTGRTFAIESLNGHPALVQADGDACGTTPICISIDPARVAMIAP